MHVLFIPKWFPDRKDPQLGDFLRKQAIATARHARVSVLHVRPDPDLGPSMEQQVIEKDGIWELHCYYRGSRSRSAGLRRAINLPLYWRAAIAGFRRVVRERGIPDIDHVHIMLRPAALAYYLRLRHGIPYLISEQSSEYFDGTFEAKGELYRRWSSFLFFKAAAVTAVSTWLGDRLVQLKLIKRYKVVPNVVPGLDRPLPPPGDPRHFMMVADLVDRTKNVSGVFRALAMARESDPQLRLTLIGDGPDRQLLEELRTHLGLQDHVRFLGRLPNAQVLDHIANAGCVIINSNIETFSVVTGEALAQGRPVIATRCGGPIAFVNEQNGILIGPRDDEALRDAMLRMARSQHLYPPEAIRRSVSANFSQEAVGNAFFLLYERILDLAGRY